MPAAKQWAYFDHAAMSPLPQPAPVPVSPNPANVEVVRLGDDLASALTHDHRIGRRA